MTRTAANDPAQGALGEIPPAGLAIGIDLGGTNIQCGVIDLGGHVLGRSKVKTDADRGLDGVLDNVARAVAMAAEQAKVEVSSVAAIGVGAPGAVDPTSGTVLEAVNLRWNDVPLAKLLRKKLGPDVFLDNDVNVAVFGEARRGAARGATDILGAWIGTGVGGGLMLGGRLFYGKHFTAGELGHMVLMPGNAPGTRSIEHNCSRTTIVNRLIYLIRANRKSMLTELVEGKLDKIKSKHLSAAYKKGDDLVVEVVHDAADRLGVGLAGIVTLLSLEKIVLGGGLTEALGEPFVARVRKSVQRESFPKAVQKVAVVQSELGDDAGLVGAGLIALHRLGV